MKKLLVIPGFCLVDMRGFAGLISQHYPQRNKKRATFDLILAPE